MHAWDKMLSHTRMGVPYEYSYSYGTSHTRILLPETYSGESNFDEWISHFETVASINEWDNAAKLKCLHECTLVRAYPNSVPQIFRRSTRYLRRCQKSIIGTIQATCEERCLRSRIPASAEGKIKQKGGVNFRIH